MKQIIYNGPAGLKLIKCHTPLKGGGRIIWQDIVSNDYYTFPDDIMKTFTISEPN